MRARPFLFQLFVTTLLRMVINTAFRMAYPFLPVFSRGVGLDPADFGGWLAVRSALGLTTPLLSFIPDRFGRRAAMLAGLAVFVAGLGLVALWPNVWTVGGALVAGLFAKVLFDPALLAFLSDATPYARRGQVLALSELGWSGAAWLGFPLVGAAIAVWGWHSPFAPLAVLGGVGMGLVLWLIPAQPPRPPAAPRPQLTVGAWWRMVSAPAVVLMMLVGALASAANEVLNVVYGRWLEGAFGLNVEQLGLTVTAIGLAELAGEGVVWWLADRLGKRRLVMLSVLANALAYALLPVLATNLLGAAVSLFLVFFTFETLIVASIPIISELNPQARATVIGANMALFGLGRVLGALLGSHLFALGLAWTGGVAAALCLLAGLALSRLREVAASTMAG